LSYESFSTGSSRWHRNSSVTPVTGDI
jgi:hypothetical protein